MFISEYFRLTDEQMNKMQSMGVFDALIDRDSNFYINIIRLKQSSVPEFINAYQHINKYFSDIATLLDAADSPSPKDKMYSAARRRFRFHEVNELNLGFSKKGYGSGWGNELSDKFLYDAYQIVKKGSKQPEIFHLVSLFEDDVGPDRLSDMIGTIIEPEIREYSLRIMRELGITPKSHSHLKFKSNGLVLNPYKKTYIYLLPEDVLHDLPIARCWDDIDRVVKENDIIREEINVEIGMGWTRWQSAKQKEYLKNHIFMVPAVCERVINGYRNQQVNFINVKDNIDYLVEYLFKTIKKSESFKNTDVLPNSSEASKALIGIFKDWVENNRGWAEIHDAPSRKREKAIQRLIHLAAKYYVSVNNLDISFEPDEGCGPSDIKLSRGIDKTIIEIKLSSNDQYLHGYETQIKRYAVAEQTTNMYYVFVDIGNPNRRSEIIKMYNEAKQTGNPVPELIVIDSCSKNAASTFVNDTQDLEDDDNELNMIGGY